MPNLKLLKHGYDPAVHLHLHLLPSLPLQKTNNGHILLLLLHTEANHISGRSHALKRSGGQTGNAPFAARHTLSKRETTSLLKRGELYF